MEKNLESNEKVLAPDLLEMFEMNSENGKTVESFLFGLRENRTKALALFSTKGRIMYNGKYANNRNSAGQTMGVKVKPDGSFEGDNVYGDFLVKVREAYRQELISQGVESVVSDKSKIIVDYILPDEYKSHVETLEENGSFFLHTDIHTRSFSEYDVGLNGTTGHSARIHDEDESWKTFVCPFGIDNRHKVKVGTMAEASLLYEKGLRGEIDWESQMAYFKKMGYVVNLSSADEANLVSDLRSQFSWMREKVMRDPSLKNMRIVAESAVVGDLSFGRTMYDPVYAPSPAHVLSYYIHNPLLLSIGAPALVVRALEEENKHEDFSFLLRNNDVEEINIFVDGTDIIGGRVPNTRSVAMRKTKVKRNKRGEIVYDKNNNPVILGYESRKVELKDNNEVEQDYFKFSQRMDSILANIPSDVKVKFWCGSGYGVPQMLIRYVASSGGRVSNWKFGSNVEDKNGKESYEKGCETIVRKGDEGCRLSVVKMKYINRFAPAIVGKEKVVSYQFKLDNKYNDMMVREEDGIHIDGAVVFTDGRDSFNGVYMRNASLAAVNGKSVICVPQNTTESEHKNLAISEHLPVRDSLVGMSDYEKSLFEGENRNSWDMKSSNSHVSRDAAFYMYGVSAYVSGRPYSSIMGLYAAMVLRERGIVNEDAYAAITLLENTSDGDNLMGRYDDFFKEHGGEVSPELEELCMRNAVHVLAQSSVVFSRELLSTGESDIICVDGRGSSRLFVQENGKGENRLGVILSSERMAIRSEMEMMRLESERIDREIALENERQKRISETHRADAVMMTGGLPKEMGADYDSIWFLGASDVDRLKFKDDRESFVRWEVTGKGDELNRELASREMLDAGGGHYVKNNLVFLYPSNRRALAGRYNISNRPDSRELLGVTRENPVTGKTFTCAFGIAVKKDGFKNEVDNPDGYASSFLSSRDSSMLNSSIVYADSKARSVAIENDQMLCYAVRDFKRRDGEESDYLTYNFQKQIYDYPTTKTTVNPITGAVVMEAGKRIPVKGTENSSRPLFKKQYIDNPHGSPALMACMRRYQSILKRGASYPLNCFLLPRADYTNVDENVFMADFNLVLSLMNAVAIERDVPMKFPLDVNGHLDLGEGVPKNYCIAAENRLKHFTNNLSRNETIQGPLPLIRRENLSDYLKANAALRSDGSDIYIRPSDLFRAFGRFDFHEALLGSSVPIHEMAFVSEDGTHFRVTDPRLSGKFSAEQVAKFSRFETDEVCRFVIRSTDPSRIPEFTRILSSYIERSNMLDMETRVISEDDLVREIDEKARKGFESLRGTAVDVHTAETMSKLFDDWKDELEFSDWLTEHNERIFVMWAKDNGISVSSVRELTGEALNKYNDHLLVVEGELFDEWKKTSGFGVESYDMLSGGVKSRFEQWKNERVEEEFHDWKRSLVSPDSLSPVQADSFRNFVTGYEFRCLDEYKESVGFEEPGERGLINISSSNSEEYANGEGEYSVRGVEDGVNTKNDFDGTSGETGYYGFEDAGDGFKGYVQYCYTLPDGTKSEWKTLADKNLAINIALSELNRVHRFDRMDELSKKVIDAEIRSLAVADARLYTFSTVEKKEQDMSNCSMRVEQSERFDPNAVEEKPEPKVFITSFDYHNVPSDALHVRVSADCPKSVVNTIQATFSMLFPKEKFDGTISESEYSRRYVEQVLEAQKDKILKNIQKLLQIGKEKGKDIYLSSEGRPGMFDTRYLISNFLNENGVECCENPADRSLYRRGHIALYGEDIPVFTSAEAERERSQEPAVVYTCSKGGYAVRTGENARAVDSDYTFQFAVNFDTAGERCTSREAGDRLVKVELPVREGHIDMSQEAVCRAAELIRNQVSQDFNDGVPFGVNIAGNGIYTLRKRGISQEQVDAFLVSVFSELKEGGMRFCNLRSGGQTGVDESAVLVGQALGIPVHVHAPSGWMYRNACDVDVSCSQDEFRKRFESKDVEAVVRAARNHTWVDGMSKGV